MPASIYLHAVTIWLGTLFAGTHYPCIPIPYPQRLHRSTEPALGGGINTDGMVFCNAEIAEIA
jgi:hypothetical protein